MHPHLPGLAGLTFESTDPDRLASADLVFLALHHEESARVAARLPAQVAVIDLSASFRLSDPAQWAGFYQGAHAGRWVYGLPELPGAREQITAARRVAAPGCHATTVILALTPLLASGLAEPGDIVAVSASGTSGAGRTPTHALLASEVMGSVSAYQVGGVHRHTPEIEQALGGSDGRDTHGLLHPAAGADAPRHPGHLHGPAGRHARRRPPPGSDALRQALATAYAGEPFIHVLPEGRWPATASTLGSNAVHLQVAADAHAGRAVVVAALDNLVKGAAGQAIQIANLMLGLPEAAGLTANGVAP